MKAFRQHPVLAAVFVVAVLLFVGLGTRMVMRTIYWSAPEHRDQRIEGWMTPGYVSRSWSVPPEVLMSVTGAPRPGAPRGQTLNEIAAAQGVTLQALADRIALAIAAHREAGR